jgi:putative flippase GtrA
VAVNGNRHEAASRQALRFLVVSVAGVLFDLAVGWALASHLGMPLWQAGCISFLVAATMNYVLHELWTFGGGNKRLSARRGMQYFGVAGMALTTRLGAIVVLEAVLGSGRPLQTLMLAAGISFGVNFLVSRWLFTRKSRVATRSAPHV